MSSAAAFAVKWEPMSEPSDARLREVFNILERHIEDRYQVPVIIKDVPDPFAGDLDGAEIHVDYAEDIESAVFIIAHLFGHTVQWNTSDIARELGYSVIENPTERQLELLLDYEMDACRYSLQLFHEAGVYDLDQWLCDYSACDLRYLLNFYKTGEKPPIKTFWEEDSPLLDPLPIPPFQTKRWVSRFNDAIVV